MSSKALALLHYEDKQARALIILGFLPRNGVGLNIFPAEVCFIKTDEANRKS